jgi:prepilin-type N-terminal cleavage/methylation domain-containing protein
MNPQATSQRRRSGFSLVELVIVSVIIGIVAAIAIPRVSRGARGAAESALRSDLAALRNAIELYTADHGVPPAAAPDDGNGAAGSETAFTNQLLMYSNAKGAVAPTINADGAVADTKDGNHIYGPYLRKQIPPLPVGTNKGSNRVTVKATGPVASEADGTGWVYNVTTGEIIANATDKDESGITTYDRY